MPKVPVIGIPINRDYAIIFSIRTSSPVGLNVKLGFSVVKGIATPSKRYLRTISAKIVLISNIANWRPMQTLGPLEKTENAYGLFFLAPGAGYLLGTFLGGRYTDVIVKQYIKKRGKRIPKDRLISSLPFLFNAACMLIDGWTIQFDRGGIPVAVIVLFLQGVGRLMCFPSLNTDCLDVMPDRSGEVVAANFVLRYIFSCVATAVVVPGIEAIGVGWISTITAAFLVLACLTVLITVIWGAKWRERIYKKQEISELQETL